MHCFSEEFVLPLTHVSIYLLYIEQYLSFTENCMHCPTLPYFPLKFPVKGLKKKLKGSQAFQESFSFLSYVVSPCASPQGKE